MRLLQAVIIGLLLLTLTPGYLFYFDVTPKTVVLLIGTAVVLIVGALSSKLDFMETPVAFGLLIVSNLASLAVSTAFSTRPALSIMGTNWREFGLVPQAAALLFAWSIAGYAGGVRVLIRGISIASLIAGIYGICQYLGWDPILPASAYHVGEGIWTIVRPPGTLGYVSYFATWLLVSAFLSMALAGMETAALWRWSAWAAATVSAAAMVLTGTRAALLGLLAGALICSYLRGFRVTRRTLAGVALAGLLGTAFYFSGPGWNLRSRARWFNEDRSGGGRMMLWRDALRMSSHRLAVGYGPETFTAEFARFESPELAATYPDFEYESTHNMFLDALTAQAFQG